MNDSYSWDTSHNQAEQTMTHTIPNEVQCVVSFRHNTLTIIHADRIIDVIPFSETGYTVNTHATVLERIAKIASANYRICSMTRKNHQLKKIRRYVSGM
jgi:hypothetical protein